MSKKLHVATTYVVKYGDIEEFNWTFDKFYDLLGCLGASTIMHEDNEDVFDFEVECEDYETAIKNLRQYIYNPATLSDEVDADAIRKAIGELDMTPREILDIMQKYYDEATTADGYLHFSAF